MRRVRLSSPKGLRQKDGWTPANLAATNLDETLCRVQAPRRGEVWTDVQLQSSISQFNGTLLEKAQDVATEAASLQRRVHPHPLDLGAPKCAAERAHGHDFPVDNA